MRYLLRFFPTLFVLVLLTSHGKSTPETARAELEQLMTVFPSIYWYASDACMRATSRAPGQLGTPEEFAAANEASISKVETGYTPVGERPIAEVQLIDPKEPNEHFIFQFVYDNDRWSTYTAYKYFGSKRTFNLYEADFIMGSMKPYIQKGSMPLPRRRITKKPIPQSDGFMPDDALQRKSHSVYAFHNSRLLRHG